MSGSHGWQLWSCSDDDCLAMAGSKWATFVSTLLLDHLQWSGALERWALDSENLRPQRRSPKRLSPKYDGPDWHVHSTETAQGGRIRNGVPWER